MRKKYGILLIITSLLVGCSPSSKIDVSQFVRNNQEQILATAEGLLNQNEKLLNYQININDTTYFTQTFGQTNQELIVPIMILDEPHYQSKIALLLNKPITSNDERFDQLYDKLATEKRIKDVYSDGDILRTIDTNQELILSQIVSIIDHDFDLKLSSISFDEQFLGLVLTFHHDINDVLSKYPLDYHLWYDDYHKGNFRTINATNASSLYQKYLNTQQKGFYLIRITASSAVFYTKNELYQLCESIAKDVPLLTAFNYQIILNYQKTSGKVSDTINFIVDNNHSIVSFNTYRTVLSK